ncbi:MAG: rod shape-determining protein MreC [Ignavibacteriales bacterium]
MAFREGPFGEVKVPLAWTAAVALIIAAIVAFTLIANDRRGTFKAQAYGVTRQAVDTVAAPVGGVLSTPIEWTGNAVNYVAGYFGAIGENRRLKRELAEMRQWRDVAIALKDRNERLESVLGLHTEPPIPMITARVVLDSRGPFANSRLANAGAADGVVVGNPVMSDRGLVGRIVGLSPHISRVLMLTDVASKVPVLIDRTNARAILSGDGSGTPKLDYLRGRDAIRQGDRILTSGDGGVFPRGLPVGVAYKALDGHWRVGLAADSSSIDFVRILKFNDFSQLADDKALTPGPIPPLKTEDPKALAAESAPAAAAAQAAAKPATSTATTAAKPKPAATGSAPKPAPKPAAATPKKPPATASTAPKPAAPKPAPAPAPAGVPY